MPRLFSFRGLIQKFGWGIRTPFKWESPPRLPPVPRTCTQSNKHCLHLEQAFETLLEEMELDTDVLDDRNIRFTTWIGLFASIQLLAWIWPCCVVLQLYVFVKLLRNQSWVNLLFSVLRDLILDSIFSIARSWFLILAQESRIANCIKNQDSQQTINFLLNGAVTVWMVDSLMK